MPWLPGCQWREVMCGENVKEQRENRSVRIVGVVSVFGTGPLKAGEMFEL